MNLLAFDADNTLWDTNGLFATAQLSLLSCLRDLWGETANEASLTVLRSIDQRLARSHPAGLKYPVEDLVVELSVLLWGKRRGEVPQEALRQMAELYERKIAGTPKPKSHVDSVLGMLAKDYHIALITEGRELTVKRNLAQLGLERWFSMLIFDRKSAVTYRSLQASIGADKAIMVGDQIDCDVHEAKLAGWRAILVPSGFCPYWTTDTDCYLPPDATISDFSQLPDALRSIEQ